MPVVHHLGIELAEGSFRLAEIRATDGYPVVLRCDDVETDRTFGFSLLHETPDSEIHAKAFLTTLARLVLSKPLFSSRATLVIPSGSAVIATIPIDAALRKEERRAQLAWECMTLSAMPPGTAFHIHTKTISRGGSAHTVLLCAVPRKTVEFLSTALRHLTLEVTDIEIDHFLFESVAEQVAGNSSTCALIGISPGRTLVSVFDGDRYLGFRAAAHMPGEASRTALRLIRDILYPSGAAIASTVLYGPAADEDVARRFRELLAVPVRLLRPLDRLAFIAGSVAEGARSRPAWFYSAALYAALKGVSCAS
ncbi:MAG: hypothetical protein QHI48_09045 [Bacteroidota bacterium]|nr:hypothetical protein [Bacteroidota bacterium]